MVTTKKDDAGESSAELAGTFCMECGRGWAAPPDSIGAVQELASIACHRLVQVGPKHPVFLEAFDAWRAAALALSKKG